MAVYLTGTVVSALFAYISSHIGRSKQISSYAKTLLEKIFAFLSFLPLTYISAVRYYVGGDFAEHIYMYNHQTFSKTEPGIAIFAKLLHYISDDPQIYFIASSVFILIGYYIAFYRESISPAYTIFIFFASSGCFFASLTAIRQYMAAALLLNALTCYHRREYKQAVLITVVAATFHNSAILIALIFFIIDFIKISPVNGAIALASSAIVTRLISPFLRRIVIQYTSYGRYFSEYYGNDTLQEKIMIFLSFYILLSYIYDKVKKYDSLRYMFSASLASLMIGFSVSTMFTPANRLMYYYESVLALYVPEALSRIERKYVRVAMYVLVTLAYVMESVIYYNTEWFKICFQHYRTFWSA